MIKSWIILFLGIFNLLCMCASSKKSSTKEEPDKTEDAISNVKYEMFVCIISVVIIIIGAVKIGLIGIGNIATVATFVSVIIGYKEEIKVVRRIYNANKNDVISISGVSAIGVLVFVFHHFMKSYSGNLVGIIELKGNFLLTSEIIVDIVNEYLFLFLAFESIVLIGLLSHGNKRFERIVEKCNTYKSCYAYIFRKSKKVYEFFILKKIILYSIMFFKDVVLNVLDIIMSFIYEMVITLCNIIDYFVKCLYALFDIEVADDKPLVFKVKNFRIISKWSIIIAMTIQYGMLTIMGEYPTEIINLYNFICGIIIIPMIITSVLELKKN